MTKTATTDIDATVEQVRALAEAGCALARIAVPTQADTRALAAIIGQSPVPIVADIHFSAQRAIEALEAGAAKIRLNPGNIKDKSDIARVLDCARRHGAAIRIGVNEASIRDLKSGDVRQDKRVALMLAEMKRYVRLFEKHKFDQIVLSAKSADVARTIAVNRAMAETFDYPIHIGLTHAGLLVDAQLPSAIAIGTLLAEGIGDTIRVSVAGDPVQEAHLAHKILQTLHCEPASEPELIVCPTCGRCQVDVCGLASQVRRLLEGIQKPVRVAVMGCIVNGPGEAADADIAVCAGSGKGFIYHNGQQVAVASADKLLDALKDQLSKWRQEKD